MLGERRNLEAVVEFHMRENSGLGSRSKKCPDSGYPKGFVRYVGHERAEGKSFKGFVLSSWNDMQIISKVY